MWRLSIPLLLLLVPSHNNNSFGLKSADGTNKHQQRRQEENNRGRSQQQRANNNQQNPWGNFGDPFGGAGAGQHQELYQALNVTPDATDKEIKSSYRKLALEFHPDKFKADPNKSDRTNDRNRALREERFVEITDAYEVLGDEKKRRVYDKFGPQGLKMLEKGQDPEAYGGYGGFGGTAGGFPTFNKEDATKMFQEMFGKSRMGGGFGGFDSNMFQGGMPNMNGFGGFPNMGSMGGDYDKMYRDAMKSFPGMGADYEKMYRDAMPNMNGFPGYGGGGERSRSGQQEKRKSKKPQHIPPPFTKGEESGVAVLTKEKFPDSRAKHGWLIYFYDRNDLAEDPTTEEYVSTTKQLASALLEKAQGNKNGMLFKVGAIDCAGSEMKFCKWKLGDHIPLPTFVTVFNGKVDVIPEDNYLKDGKQLYDEVIDALSNIDGLVVNVNSMKHIQTRLLGSSPSPGQTTVAVLLLNDKNDTPAMYKSLAYRHRGGGVVFGESRGDNSAQLSRELLGLELVPHILAIIASSDSQRVEKFTGKRMNPDSLSKWIEGLKKKTV